jgi:metallo-beta-lactamase family protein
MSIAISFLGAARSVTGSRYLIEANGKRILVDCGLYQERALQERNWESFPVPPNEIDVVLLTHAHLDHCGLLPKLVREGYRGDIVCTSATRDITEIVMLDSAKIQEEDVAFKIKRHKKEGRESPRPLQPLYTVADAERATRQLRVSDYGKPRQLGNGIEASFHDAGHILGAASIRLRVASGNEVRELVFSGDIGRWGVPFLQDPTVFDRADYVVMESTYGDRNHEDAGNINETIARIINETRKAGGNIIIPSFAVERSQELLYRLHELKLAKRIPHMLVFLDSPMAVRVTEVFQKHPELFDAESMQRLREGTHPCDFPGLQIVRTVAQSKGINHIRGSVVVIAGSGMCTGGRIKHHLARDIVKPESTILFVGYQAVGTLGRQILDGAKEVRILGQKLPVRARVERVGGFSGHADRGELQRWISGLKSPPRRVFITHGEPEPAESFAALIREKLGYETRVPEYKERCELA